MIAHRDVVVARKRCLLFTVSGMVLLLFAVSLHCQAQTSSESSHSKTIARMPFNRVVAGALEFQERIWVIGGQTDRVRATASIGVYDPKTDRWEQGPDMPSSRSTVASAVVGNECFVMGGISGDQLLAEVLSYKPGQATWTLRAKLPTPRYQTCAAAIGERLFLVGGGDRQMENQEPCRDLLEYLPSADRWEKRAQMPFPMRNAGAVAFGGKLYVVGGHSFRGTNNRGQLLQCYDPQSDSWSARAPMPTPRTDIAVVLYQGRIFVLGGHPSLATVESYDVMTDSWRAEKPLPHGRVFHTAVATEAGIYVLGGFPEESLLYKP